MNCESKSNIFEAPPQFVSKIRIIDLRQVQGWRHPSGSRCNWLPKWADASAHQASGGSKRRLFFLTFFVPFYMWLEQKTTQLMSEHAGNQNGSGWRSEGDWYRYQQVLMAGILIFLWQNQYPSDNWPWNSVGQNSMRKWSRWRYKKTNNIFGEKRNKKVPPSRQHVVQLTWSQSWLLESLAAWPMFTRCIDYMVLVTYYLYRLYIFPDFQKKTSKLFRTRSW